MQPTIPGIPEILQFDEKEAGEGKRKLKEKETEVEKLRKKVEASGWSSEKESQNEMALRSAKATVRQLTEVFFSD